MWCKLMTINYVSVIINISKKRKKNLQYTGKLKYNYHIMYLYTYVHIYWLMEKNWRIYPINFCISKHKMNDDISVKPVMVQFRHINYIIYLHISIIIRENDIALAIIIFMFWFYSNQEGKICVGLSRSLTGYWMCLWRLPYAIW